MKNYLCKPNMNDKKAKALVLSLLVIALVFFYLSTLYPSVKAVFQLFSSVLLLLFIQVTNRFLLTRYRYALEEGHLLISTRQARKEKNLGGIPITGKTVLLDQKSWEKEKEKYRVSSRFSYCQNLFAQAPGYLLVPEEKGWLLLIFEPDETLWNLILEQISLSKKDNTDE